MSAPWEGKASPRDLTGAHFRRAAERLGCDVPAIRAVWEVEAGGQHFLPDGSLIRRFEPHHFPRGHWGQIGFAVRSGEAPWRASLRLSSEAMFQAAAEIDTDAAMRAASWGAPQIMGFNHADAGFASPREMVAHMAGGADAQLGAFVQLVEGWGLATAIRAHDWAAFARRYNGSGQVAEYARRMESAYRRHSGGERSPVVLRVGDRGAGVARLQRALGIEDDGAFGPATLAAVRGFQHESGLAVDGVVGAKTWAALENSAAAYGLPAEPPPAQESTGEAIEREVGRWSGIAAAVTAALAGAREALPEDALTLLVGGAVLAGLVWFAVTMHRRLA